MTEDAKCTSDVPEDSNSTTTWLFHREVTYILIASTSTLVLLVGILLIVILVLYSRIRKLRITSKSNLRLISSFTKSSSSDSAMRTYETVGNSSKIVKKQSLDSKKAGKTEVRPKSKSDNGNVPAVEKKTRVESKTSIQDCQTGMDKEIEELEKIQEAISNSVELIQNPDPDKCTVRYAKVNKNKPSVVRDPDPDKKVADEGTVKTDITSDVIDSEI